MKRLRLICLRRVACLALLLGGVALAFSCNAPFIPVPPPGAITFTSQMVSDANGAPKTVWITSGGANEKAVAGHYFVYDLQQQAGVIAHADDTGAFTAPAMDGKTGDIVLIYYRTNKGEYSDSTCRTLMEGTSTAQVYCPLELPDSGTD